MLLTYEQEIDPIQFQHLDSENFRAHLSAKAGQELGRKIMEFTELKEQPRVHPNVKFKAQVHVLPLSQYEHVVNLLNTIKGIHPEVDKVISQIVTEL